MTIRIAAAVLALAVGAAALPLAASAGEAGTGTGDELEALRRALLEETGPAEESPAPEAEHAPPRVHGAGEDVHHHHHHHGGGEGAERTPVSFAAAARFFALQLALLAVVLVLHTYIGLHVVRRVLVFSDLVLDQLAAFGALVGIGIGVAYGTPASYLLALGAVLLGALLLAVIRPKSRALPREAVIGVMYALALVACLLLADKLSGGDAHVAKTLSGSIEWVSWKLVAVTAAVYVGLLVFHYFLRAKFIAIAEGTAPVGGERLWDFLFFATQGIITVLIVPVAGVLLAYSFLMIPAAIAAMFTRGWGRALALGWGLGFGACAAGLTASFFLDLPYGPSLVLALGVVFVVALLVRALRRAGSAAGEGAA